MYAAVRRFIRTGFVRYLKTVWCDRFVSSNEPEDMWLCENCALVGLLEEVFGRALFGLLRGLKTVKVYGMIG